MEKKGKAGKKERKDAKNEAVSGLPTGAIISGRTTEQYKTGGWRSFRPVLLQEKCKKCGLCFVFCPDNAVKKTKNGFEIDLDYCKGCGICAKECPAKAILMKIEEK